MREKKRFKLAIAWIGRKLIVLGYVFLIAGFLGFVFGFVTQSSIGHRTTPYVFLEFLVAWREPLPSSPVPPTMFRWQEAEFAQLASILDQYLGGKSMDARFLEGFTYAGHQFFGWRGGGWASSLLNAGTDGKEELFIRVWNRDAHADDVRAARLECVQNQQSDSFQLYVGAAIIFVVGGLCVLIGWKIERARANPHH